MMMDRRRKITPPPSLRCARQNGKHWRCKNWRLHDKLFCQVHYFKQQVLLNQGKSLPSNAIAPPNYGSPEKGENKPAGKTKKKRKKVAVAVEWWKSSLLQHEASSSE